MQGQQSKTGLPAGSTALLVGVLGLAGGPLWADADRPPAIVVPTPAPESPREPQPTAPRVIEHRVQIVPGENLVTMLAAAGVDHQTAERWGAAAGLVIDLRRLVPGNLLTLQLVSASGLIETLRYEIDRGSTLIVEREGDLLRSRRETRPLTVELRGVAGRIEHGLWADVIAMGAPPGVAGALSEAFGGEVDFGRLRQGDEFRVLYEVVRQDGSDLEEAGDVVGASIDTGGRRVTTVLFEDMMGRGGYYRPDGEAVGPTMLRYPVAFTRISSGFTPRRYHPVLRRTRPHLGVDFAAPAGTPVHAAADGGVTLAGWDGGLGRTVRLQHARGLDTAYGHLDRIAEGVFYGARVERGQVIGYVGASGLATGAHLHYAVRRQGVPVDPLGLDVGAATVVPPAQQAAFARVRDAVTDELDRIGPRGEPVVVTMARRAGLGG